MNRRNEIINQMHNEILKVREIYLYRVAWRLTIGGKTSRWKSTWRLWEIDYWKSRRKSVDWQIRVKFEWTFGYRCCAKWKRRSWTWDCKCPQRTRRKLWRRVRIGRRKATWRWCWYKIGAWSDCIRRFWTPGRKRSVTRPHLVRGLAILTGRIQELRTLTKALGQRVKGYRRLRSKKGQLGSTRRALARIVPCLRDRKRVFRGTDCWETNKRSSRECDEIHLTRFLFVFIRSISIDYFKRTVNRQSLSPCEFSFSLFLLFWLEHLHRGTLSHQVLISMAFKIIVYEKRVNVL